MTDNRIEVEGIRESADNRLLILALIFFGSTRWSARTCVTIGNMLRLINIRYRSICCMRINRLSFCWPCRNGHVDFIDHLVSGFVKHRDNPLCARLYRLVKLNNEMCVDVDVVSILLRIKTYWRLCQQFHTYDESCHCNKDSFRSHCF